MDTIFIISKQTSQIISDIYSKIIIKKIYFHWEKELTVWDIYCGISSILYFIFSNVVKFSLFHISQNWFTICLFYHCIWLVYPFILSHFVILTAKIKVYFSPMDINLHSLLSHNVVQSRSSGPVSSQIHCHIE